jgi:hypothetical protein
MISYSIMNSNKERITYKIYNNDYIEKFWVGLMDGNGNIQINVRKK